MNQYLRGSEWRKWDLHVHAPGTKLADAYDKKNGSPDLGRFCKAIHESDVAVVAIADYFSLDSYFAIKHKYTELYPEDETLLLPNLELRLPVSVNRDGQKVNLHLIFSPSLTTHEASRFLDNLKTEGTVGQNRTKVRCSDLDSKDAFNSATVAVAAIDEAIKAVFGEHATAPSARQEHLLVVDSAKGDGIRPGGSGIQRKNLLTDEIDKFCDAFYANPSSREHFLDTDRLETSEQIAPKPIFDGCDAHSFTDLQEGLGKQVTTAGRQRNITWIKANPTYAGLLQTIVEPHDRVAIQASAPDQKEPYKVISKVRFTGAKDFPPKVKLNRNLSAIIGSRSSGKSALLAHIAHAVNPDETARLQAEAHGLHDPKAAGPAAGLTWEDAADVVCEVDWESGEQTTGKVVYIPQNSLYRLSEHPEEITKKISPALFRTYPYFKSSYDAALDKVRLANGVIKQGVDDWFALADRIDALSQEIGDVGDEAAVIAERDRLQADLDLLRDGSKLSDEEIAEYQAVATELDRKEARLKEAELESDILADYVARGDKQSGSAARPHAIQATITVRPSMANIPDQVATRIDDIKSEAEAQLVSSIETALVDAFNALEHEQAELRSVILSMKADNAELIANHEADENIAELVADHKGQVVKLEAIARKTEALGKLDEEQAKTAAQLTTAIADRDDALSLLVDAFNAEERLLAALKFGIEIDVPTEAIAHATKGFSQRSTSDYIKSRGDSVAYQDAQGAPATFLRALRDRKVALNKSYEPDTVAADVLTLTKEVRFTAELDSDVIGGFKKSSMTPGKQALFALTLLLNESQEPWPLLIDQPEDDLDSRSIYDTIVPYLIERKKERQIIMVSHNANLVIGADSEQVIVANRHGDDRKNRDSRTFEYMTGALEHSQSLDMSSATVLNRCGIREHACEILDGGEEAFLKRRHKYHI